MYSYKSTKAPAGYITGIILGDMLAALLKSYGYMLFNSEGQKKYQVYYKEIKNSVSKIDNGCDFPGKKYYYNKVEVEAYLKRIEGELEKCRMYSM